MGEATAGWAMPSNAHKYHYFTDAAGRRSLCRQWRFFGVLDSHDLSHDDNCKDCERRRALQRATEA